MSSPFRAGHRYCCNSPECQTSLVWNTDWYRLCILLLKQGIIIPSPLKLLVRVVCERGALFARDPGSSDPGYEAVDLAWEAEFVHDESAGEDDPA